MAKLTALPHRLPMRRLPGSLSKQPLKEIEVIPPKEIRRYEPTPAEYSRWLSRVRGESIDSLIDAYAALGIEYIMWETRKDGRVRESHAELDGEVVKIGTRFSNGLLFPGDFSRYKPEEQVNCRCTPVPVKLPIGYRPPRNRFRMHELLKVKPRSK